MQILRNQALDLVGVVPAMENDWSVIPIDMKWEIFFDQSGEKFYAPPLQWPNTFLFACGRDFSKAVSACNESII